MEDKENKVGKRRRSDLNLIACNRCKTRKQKCTGDFTTGRRCLGCERANLSCEYSEKRNPNYVQVLEQRVAHLEGMLQKLQEEKIMDNNINTVDARNINEKEAICHDDMGNISRMYINGDTNENLGTIFKNSFLETSSDKSSSPDIIESLSDNSVLTKCATLFPLKDDMEPLYVGSSGLNIASLLQAHLKLELAESLKVNNPPPSASNLDSTINEYVTISFDDLLNDDSKLKQYVEIYISRVHYRYPFLLKSTILQLHENRDYYLKTSKIHKKKKNILNSFILLMIYAIGSMIIGKKSNQFGISDPSFRNDNFLFFTNAMKLDLSIIFEHKSILNIHAMLLTVIYQLRLPNGPVIWDMVGFALRLCVNFGFHRKNIDLLHRKPLDYQQRTLTFWSTYSLERSISGSFGRPFSLSDRDIDVNLPIDIDESIVDGQLLIEQYYLELNNKVKFEKVTSLTQAIHNFKFKKIESQIQNEIYRVDVEINDIPRDKINSLILQMKEWVAAIPPSLTSIDYDYYLYLFNKQIRCLVQPFLSKLDKNDILFRECMKGSLTVCQLTKRMYQNTKIRLSFISLQTVFLSGVTLIYGILSKKINWNFDTSEGLRCCSSILFSVAQRATTCKIFSEIFEKLVTMVRKEAGEETANDDGLNDQVENSDSLDLFGQNCLKKNVHDSHSKENLEIFNEITNKDNNLKELENIFNFGNLDILGTKQLDDIIKKASSTKLFDDDFFLQCLD